MTSAPFSGYALAAQIAELERQKFLVTGMTVEKANGFYSLHYFQPAKPPPQQPELFSPTDRPGVPAAAPRDFA